MVTSGLAFLVVAAALIAGEARATDVDEIMATLKDEASECRYYQQLCDTAEQAFVAAANNADLIEKARQEGKPDATYVERLPAIRKAMHRAADDVRNGRNIIRAKHATPPKCLAADIRCTKIVH